MAISAVISPLLLLTILSLSLALDTSFAHLLRRPESRFLAHVSGKNGGYCDLSANKPCSGGDGRVKCCSKKCTDVRWSRNNCGACGRRCGYGQLCCNGRCSKVAYDAKNCGGCGVGCKPGLRCTYGMCGYA